MSENRLRLEKSPYLLQHQHNPVHWYAWGPEAFAAAKRENKPIFLSIGYSTCHWCHVMERESFETQEVADALNRDFISIKVDREERPDIDEIYMSAVQAMKQRGGWPLSAFLTPDLKPFFGGTYYPKAHFLALLQNLADIWRKEPEKVLESSESFYQYLVEQKASHLEPVGVSPEVFSKFYRNSLMSFDPHWGGFGEAPKFPHAMQISMLLRIHRRTSDTRALFMSEQSLERMARGGIYDHLGYGFARYSTDARWLVPHFEKMLYDNALLVVAYLEAYQATKKDLYRRVAQESLDYVLRVMTHPEGGFYSAEDADSEGEEGKFYVWDYEELRGALSPDEFDLFSRAYQAEPNGNFEGKNILWLSDDYDWAVKDEPLMRSARDKLFPLREGRIHPHKDDKILTAWNGLMIRAMALGYQVLGDKRYLAAAKKAAGFVKDKLDAGGRLLARYRDGEARFAARLEDFAFLIQALIDLHQCEFDPDILRWAAELQGRQDKLFWDEKGGAYFFTDGSDPTVLVRSKEAMDGALPNGNAVSALNLLRLEGLTGAAIGRVRAEKIFQTFSRLLMEYPQAFAQLMIALDYYTDAARELAIVTGEGGDGSDEVLKNIRASFQPNLVLARGPAGENLPLLQDRPALEGKTAYYVCEARTCLRPTDNPQAALQAIQEPKRYALE